ncbi:hypothetical protein H0H93_007231 [Arthromyces matolae]|nr:hypothetical protein H0H93_007231 [Arthromyces matolae]
MKPKKSETVRSPQVPFISSEYDDSDSSPQIPLPTDFRTSLILPDLSRRFSLLRSPSGDPVGLDVLRGRLADQRKRGAANQISEEEEELIFDTLRGFGTNSTSSGHQSEEEDANSPETDYSSNLMHSPLSPTSPSSPSGRIAKRYSNNLFGSGRFNDYNYIRTVTKSTSSRTSSLTPTEASYRRGNASNTSSTTDSLIPTFSEGSMRTSSVHSQTATSNTMEPESSVRSAPSTPYGEQQQLVSVAEYRISKALGPSALKRASMALEAAIKEFEEEAEEILMPRSTPVPKTHEERSQQFVEPPPAAVQRTSISHSSIFEAVMAISSDKQVQNDPEVVNRRSSPVPTRTLPGYVPGMPRPMTPREFDLEEQRSHSTTPRATSPSVSVSLNAAADSPMTSLVSTNRRRSNSSTSQIAPRSPTSPLFLQRSPNNGRFTPEDGNATESEATLSSSLLPRRRPASPLAGPPFQPLAVSSRPSTPSTVIWNTNIDTSNHTRNASWASNISSSNIHGAQSALEQFTSGPRNVHSPSLPDSPIDKNGLLSALEASFNSMNKMSVETNTSTHTPPLSVTDVGSPVRITQRSVTPTQSTSRSPISPTFPNFGGSPNHQRPSQQNSLSTSVSPLVFSPLVNPSRSSLGSDGSSYRTFDGENEDLSSLLFLDADSQPSVWHDLSSPSTSVSADSPDEHWNPEEIVARATGLKKADFVVIQEKLLNAKDAKEKELGRMEPQERAASSLRKRRPSTSQSNYSYKDRDSRVASPPPQSPTKSVATPNRERPSSALGNNASPSSPRDRATFARDKDISPSARRNRDLAQALFGREDTENLNTVNTEIIPQSKPMGPTPTPASPQLLKPSSTNDTISSTSTLSPAQQAPYQMGRNPSVPRIPQTPQEEEKLVQEVKERIDAATEFLKPSKTSGSHSPDPNATVSRRRVSPSQISTPTLVASSTVVDTIPIKPPSIASTNTSGPSKIGSRFRMLRGTLRAKNPPPNSDEPASSQSDAHLPPSIQVAHYDPAKLKAPSSATEARFKVPVPSPPASAGPGLKGFMARFRGKPRPAAEPTLLQAPPQSPSLSSLPPANTNTKSVSQASSMTVGRKPAPSSRSETPQVPLSPPETTPTQAAFEDSGPTQIGQSSDMNALRQLFEAADKIGLDQGELTSLLARSGSTSSKADWSALARSNSAVRQRATSPVDSLTPPIGQSTYDAQSMRAPTPDPKNFEHENQTSKRSLDGQLSRDKAVSRQTSRKQQTDSTRRPREGKAQGDTNAVVRKTIIVPDINMTADELKTFMEKSMPGRRLSVTSTSSRSVHDRVPTPPPPRSPTFKRFSGQSPPLPSLPAALGNLNVPSAAAGGSIEKSNSTYDSLYDMYAGETRSPSTTPNEPGPSRPNQDGVAVGDSGAAVELIHLANGETIWNIVNGLREDDDDNSIYTRRTSFTSEYGGAHTANDDGVQVFVKEHNRSGSRGSTSSFLSRKRSPGKHRPETKLRVCKRQVFYSPADGIGRLIHELSQNMEAGSFNFALRQGVPGHGHSASSSMSTNDIAMSLEERLDQMIDTYKPAREPDISKKKKGSKYPTPRACLSIDLGTGPVVPPPKGDRS